MSKNPFQHFYDRFIKSETRGTTQNQKVNDSCTQIQTYIKPFELSTRRNYNPCIYIYGRDSKGIIKRIKKDIIAYEGDYGYCGIETVLLGDEERILDEHNNIEKVLKKTKKGKKQEFIPENVLVEEIHSLQDCYVDFTYDYIGKGYAKIHKNDFFKEFNFDELEIVAQLFYGKK